MFIIVYNSSFNNKKPQDNVNLTETAISDISTYTFLGPKIRITSHVLNFINCKKVVINNHKDNIKSLK